MKNRLFKNSNNRKGFVLYIVVGLAIGLFVLIAGLNSFKSGAVLQLTKNSTQDKMIVVAQSAINEALAKVKSEINTNGTDIGNAVRNFWASGQAAPARICDLSLNASNLKLSSQMANEYLTRGDVSCDVSMYAVDSINEAMVNSYIGYVKLVAKVSCDGVKDAVKVTEQHDLKIIDLSYPVLDMYVLFVKNYCWSLNDTKDINFVVNGIKDGDADSHIYLGNRNYPNNSEYGNNPPQVLLDVDIEKDAGLLDIGDLQGFQVTDTKAANTSQGKFFMVGQIPFTNFLGQFENRPDLFSTTFEIRQSYKNLRDQCKISYEEAKERMRSNAREVVAKYTLEQLSEEDVFNEYFQNVRASTIGQVVEDYEEKFGTITLNELGDEIDISQCSQFQLLLKELFPIWKYNYGYTDFRHITEPLDDGKPFLITPPFHGLATYWEKMQSINPCKLMGGAMPAFFGENRDIPIYFDGPVYIRFYKIGMMDECMVPFPTITFPDDNEQPPTTGEAPIHFYSVGCDWEKPNETFSGIDLGEGSIDDMTHHLMCEPIEDIDINLFFYRENYSNKDNQIKIEGGMEINGDDVYHYLDPQLRTISSFYESTSDFLTDHVKELDGQMTLTLDGISYINNFDGNDLDLSNINLYNGKGMVILYTGNCILGNLLPKEDDREDFLKICLKGGGFKVNGGGDVKIKASLIALNEFSNGYGTFETGDSRVELLGNLVIDDLGEKNIKNLLLIHDTDLYTGDPLRKNFPVRVSVGTPKTMYALDYKGKD